LSRAFRMKRDTIYKPALRLDVVEKTVFHLKRHYRGILSLITSSSHFSSIGFAVPPDPGIDPLGDLYSSPICRSQRRQTAMPSRSGSRLQESASATSSPAGVPAPPEGSCPSTGTSSKYLMPSLTMWWFMSCAI